MSASRLAFTLVICFLVLYTTYSAPGEYNERYKGREPVPPYEHAEKGHRTQYVGKIWNVKILDCLIKYRVNGEVKNIDTKQSNKRNKTQNQKDKTIT